MDTQNLNPFVQNEPPVQDCISKLRSPKAARQAIAHPAPVFKECMSPVISRADRQWMKHDQHRENSNLQHSLVNTVRQSRETLSLNFDIILKEMSFLQTKPSQSKDVSPFLHSIPHINNNWLQKLIREGKEIHLHQLLGKRNESSAKFAPSVVETNKAQKDKQGNDTLRPQKPLTAKPPNQTPLQSIRHTQVGKKTDKVTVSNHNNNQHQTAAERIVDEFGLTTSILQCIAESLGDEIQYQIDCLESEINASTGPEKMNETSVECKERSTYYLLFLPTCLFVECFTKTSLRSFLEASSEKNMNVESLAHRIAGEFEHDCHVDTLQAVLNLVFATSKTHVERLQVVLCLCGDDVGLCRSRLSRLLFPHDTSMAEKIQRAEFFLDEKLDQDHDGVITFSEFIEAARCNDHWLNQILRSLSNTKYLDLMGRRKLNDFIVKCHINWKILNHLFDSFENIKHPLMEQDFISIVYPLFSTPVVSDGLLLRELFELFSNSNTTGVSVLSLNESQMQEPVLNSKEFLLTLAIQLRSKIHVEVGSLESVIEKATFCFQFFNLDGDSELSREEVYQMLYQGDSVQCKSMLDVLQLFQIVEQPRHGGVIGVSDYIEGAQQAPKLLEPFQETT